MPALKYRAIIIAVTVLVYLAIGYYPFQFEMPVRVSDNGASYSTTGGLQLLQPGIAHTTGTPAWLDSAIAGSTLHISLEVKPTHARQYGPARILTLSRDPFLRNFTIGQNGGDLIVRLRTPATDLNGFPPYRLRGALAAPGWHRIDIGIAPHLLQVSVDGIAILSTPLPRDALANWARNYRLALGNELTHDRPWLGEIRHAKVVVGEREIDYSQPGALEIPRHLAVIQAHHILNPWRWDSLAINTDFVINLLGFIPLGILLFCLAGGGRSVLAVTALCASVSLGIEAGQLFFAGRVTETQDLILNTLGGALGAWVGMQLRWCRTTGVTEHEHSKGGECR